MPKQDEHIDDFTGRAELLFPSRYIKAAELEEANKPVTLTIARVEKNAELVMVGGQKDAKPVIHFDETPKMLVLNKTNLKRIMEHHGNKVSEWKGKKVTLIAERESRSPSGVAVRVKEKG